MPCASRKTLAGLVTILVAAALLPAGSGSHADATYDHPVWFTWDTTQIDVLVVPPNHGQLLNGNGVLNNLDPMELTPWNSYLGALRHAFADWDKAIAQYGSAQLRSSFKANIYILGFDSVPASALLDPEIIYYTDESKAYVLGVAVNAYGLAPCLVSVSKLYLVSYSYADMYNIAGHEYGHCLGLHHVLNDHPAHDMMDGSYDDPVGEPGNHLHCISNLNVRALERVFGAHWNGDSGGTATIPIAQYGTMAC